MNVFLHTVCSLEVEAIVHTAQPVASSIQPAPAMVICDPTMGDKLEKLTQLLKGLIENFSPSEGNKAKLSAGDNNISILDSNNL